jgi:hypothetical protein
LSARVTTARTDLRRAANASQDHFCALLRYQVSPFRRTEAYFEAWRYARRLPDLAGCCQRQAKRQLHYLPAGQKRNPICRNGTAIEVLMLSHGGPAMMARTGVLRALHRDEVEHFNPTPKRIAGEGGS